MHRVIFDGQDLGVSWDEGLSVLKPGWCQAKEDGDRPLLVSEDRERTMDPDSLRTF